MSSWLKKPKRDEEPLRVRPDINDVLPPSVRQIGRASCRERVLVQV